MSREAARQKRREVARIAGQAREQAEKIDALLRQAIVEYVVMQDKLHEISLHNRGKPARHQV